MFRYKVFGTTLLLVFSLFLAACSRTIIAREVPPTVVIEPERQSNGSEVWLDALRAAGAAVEASGEVTQPFFSANGQVVSINGNEVQLFVYDDEATAKSEAGQVSPEGTAVGPNIMMWMATPHFYRSASTIALYIGDDETTLALLEKVFGSQFAGGQSTASTDEIGEAANPGYESPVKS